MGNNDSFPTRIGAEAYNSFLKINDERVNNNKNQIKSLRMIKYILSTNDIELFKKIPKPLQVIMHSD